MEDRVNHPNHYTFGEIEVITYIRDKLTTEEFVGYCNGNVLKYVSRWRHKGGLEDLRKAQVYLGWAIEAQEKDLAKKIEAPDLTPEAFKPLSEILALCDWQKEVMNQINQNAPNGLFGTFGTPVTGNPVDFGIPDKKEEDE